LKGKCLLEPLRIRCITGDVKWHLKSFHNFLSDIKKKVSMTAKEKEDGKLDDATDNCRSTKLLKELDTVSDRCMLGIESIIPHHAGDHSLCSIDNCVYLQVQRSCLCHYQVLNEGSGSKEIKTEIEK
jgi:hypothetical protein